MQDHRRRGITDEMIATEYRRLRSARLVAESFGFCKPTVYAALKRMGVERTAYQPPRRSGATDQDIAEAYERLKSGIATAKELRVTEKTVYDALARMGIETTGHAEYLQSIRRISDHDREAVATMFKNGRPVRSIAAHFECSASAIVLALEEMGIDPHTKPRLSDEEKITVKSMYERGISFAAIARKLDRAEPTLRSFIHKEHPHLLRPWRAKGESSPAWRGGRTVHKQGYVSVVVADDDPFACMRDQRGYVPEHRLVMARKLGRALRASETVHHINGRKDDNRPENLELRQGKHGKGVRHVCRQCGSHDIVEVGLNHPDDRSE